MPKQDFFNNPAFSNYQLPGGKNYEETTVHLPQDALSSELVKLSTELENNRSLTTQGQINLQTKITDLRSKLVNFSGGHYPSTDIIAHYRTNETSRQRR